MEVPLYMCQNQNIEQGNPLIMVSNLETVESLNKC